jgi:serine protease
MRRLVLFALVVAVSVGVPRLASARAVNDAGRPLQWGLDQIGAADAWDRATGEGFTIAIVDSGVDLRHEDFQLPGGGSKIVANVSCLGANGDPARCVAGKGQDDNGHGTHVAGIAAAVTNNGKGVAGVAPDARLLAVRVLQNDCGGGPDDGACDATGTANDVIAGIVWAADHGAAVINLSLGSTAQAVFGPGFDQALRYAWGKGAIPVVATGNDVVLPSGFSDEPAIVVAATSRAGEKASYSNSVGSARWAVAAPGGELGDVLQDCSSGGRPQGVLSTYWRPGGTNEYACEVGTSMAAPHVSGSLAVLRSEGLSPDQAVQQVLATADDLGAPGRDATFGSGRLNLARAVRTASAAGRNAQPAPDGATTTSAAPPGQTVPQAPTGTRPANAGNDGVSSTTTTAPAGPSGSTATTDAGGSDVAAPPGGGDSDDDNSPPGGLVLLAVALVIAAASAGGWLVRRGRAPNPF